MALTGTLKADFSEFVAAVTNAEKHLTNMSAGADRAGARLNAMQDSFSGKKIIQDATLMTAAVERAGGASVLTAKEMARVNATVTEAIAKYAALGQQAPPAMIALADATKRVEAPTEGLSTKMVALGSFIGTMAANAVAALGRMAIEGIGRIVTGMGDLILSGAGVADVGENFTRLTAQAGLLGQTLLGTLRAGTHATVTDFELMKTVNQDLAAGMRLTDAQFGTLAKGAFALAQATGTDVKGALDTMNDAMLTGRTRALALLTGKIDLEAAENKYAASIGKLSKNLNEAEKLEAARAGILDGVTAATKRLGDQTDGLDERIAQATTAWANFKHELGAMIATSPVVMAAFDSMAASLKSAFGESQHTLVKNVAHTVEDLSITLVDVASVGVSSAKFIAEGFLLLRGVLFGVLESVANIFTVMADGQAKVAEFASSIPLYGRQWTGVAKDARFAADAVSSVAASFKATGDDAFDSMGKVRASFDGANEKIAAMRSAMNAAQGATTAHTSATDKLGTSTENLGRTLSKNEITEHAQRLKSAHKVLIEFNAEVDKQNAGFLRGMATMGDFTKEIEKYTDRTAKAIISNALIGKAAETERGQFVRQNTMTTVNFQIQEIERWATNEKLKLDQSVAGWADAAAKIEAIARAKTQALIEADEVYQRILFANLDVQAKLTMKAAAGIATAFKNIGPTILAAVQGGGNVFEAVGSSLGMGLGQSVVKKFGESIKTKLGETLGGAVNAVLPGIGALLGPLAGFIGGLFTDKNKAQVTQYNAEIEKLRAGLLTTHGTLDDLEAAGHRVGISFRENWGHQGQKGLEAMNALIAEFEERTEAVAGAMGRVSTGFSAVVTGMTKPWIELGKTADEAAKKALDAYTKYQDALADPKSSGAAENLRAEYEKLFKESSGLHDQLARLGQANKHQLADMGIQAVASFGAALVAGKSYAEAIALIGPSTATLGKAFKALGIDVEDVALKHLILQSTVAAGNPELIAAASGLGEAMQGLAQLGMLNADAFAAMQRTGSAMYQRLQGEVANLGGDSRDALLPMQDYLHQAATQAELLGIPLDANTQMLIDQSRELGIWKDKGVSAQDKLIAGMQTMVEKVDELLTKMLGFSGAITNLPSRKDIEINITENITRNIRESSGEGVAWGGPQARGGDYRVTRPTLFLAGEAGPERVTFNPESNGAPASDSSASTQPIIINNHIVVDMNGPRNVSESEFDQIQARLFEGGLQVPARVITQRTR